MTKKEVLRKVLSILSWLVLIHLTVGFLLGDRDIFFMICLGICYGCFMVDIVIIIICKIILKVMDFKDYKLFKEGYEYLKTVHNTRYKLYFSANKEIVNVYSQEIQRYGNALLNVGSYLIENKILGKKKIKEVQEIVDKIQELMRKEFVIY